MIWFRKHYYLSYARCLAGISCEETIHYMEKRLPCVAVMAFCNVNNEGILVISHLNSTKYH